MDMTYECIVISIVSASLFALIFIIYLITFYHTRRKEERQMESLSKMYLDRNLVKMEYDFALYDNETEALISKMQHDDGQITIDDLINAEAAAADSIVFGTVDTEGLEEITGNYKPE